MDSMKILAEAIVHDHKRPQSSSSNDREICPPGHHTGLNGRHYPLRPGRHFWTTHKGDQ